MTTEFPWPHGDVTKHWDTGLMECDICHRQGRTMRELAEQPCVEPAMIHDPLAPASVGFLCSRMACLLGARTVLGAGHMLRTNQGVECRSCLRGHAPHAPPIEGGLGRERYGHGH